MFQADRRVTTGRSRRRKGEQLQCPRKFQLWRCRFYLLPCRRWGTAYITPKRKEEIVNVMISNLVLDFTNSAYCIWCRFAQMMKVKDGL